MRAEFSEFQFGYSVTKEIEDEYYENIIPFIPNQRQEADVGYDVRFTGEFTTLYLQYKLAELLTNEKAKEWEDFEQKYFRFKIYPANVSTQHNTLYDLANSDSRNKVYYCAPLFITLSNFIRCHSTPAILSQSVAVNCKNLQRIAEDDKHCFCYAINNDTLEGNMYSNKYSVKVFRLSEVLKYKETNELNIYKNFDDFETNIYNFIKNEKNMKEYLTNKFSKVLDIFLKMNNLNLYFIPIHR